MSKHKTRLSHPHHCDKCGEDYYYLQDNDIVIHTCACDHDWIELEDDNGNKARGCTKCKRLEV